MEGDELEFPDQPRPGAAVHRPRPGRAAARHRGQPGHHRAQRPRHRHRPDRSRLRDQAQRRPPQPLPDPGPPPAARTRHPGTRHRRRPGPPRGRRRETAADRDRPGLRPPQPGVHDAGRRAAPGSPAASSGRRPVLDPDTPASFPARAFLPDRGRPYHRRAQRRARHRIRPCAAGNSPACSASSSAGVATSAAVIMVAEFSIPATLPTADTKTPGAGLAAAVLIDATVVRGILLPAASPCRGAVLLRVRDATIARGSPKPRRTNRTTAPSRRTGRSVPSVTMQKAYPAPLIIGREDVDCAYGPASEVLAWYGRRV